jgi:hypothetical protein
VRNVLLLVATGVIAEGDRDILGICESAKKDKSGWSAFPRHLVDRGLKGVELITLDAYRALVESLSEYLPQAHWQRCLFISQVSETKVCDVWHRLKAIRAQENRAAAEATTLRYSSRPVPWLPFAKAAVTLIITLPASHKIPSSITFQNQVLDASEGSGEQFSHVAPIDPCCTLGIEVKKLKRVVGNVTRSFLKG